MPFSPACGATLVTARGRPGRTGIMAQMNGQRQSGEQVRDGAMGAPAREPLGRVAVRWLTRASVLGILLSLMFHVVLGIVAALVTIERAQAGGATGEDEIVEFAVVTEAELAQLQQAALDTPLPEIPEEALSGDLSDDPLDTPTDDRLMELLDDMGQFEASVGAGDIEGADIGGPGGGGGGATSFFGVEARGSRFAYIVDNSTSMALDPQKILKTKQQLNGSVQSLAENASFFVVLYSDAERTIPLGGRKEWVEASPSNKRWARQEIADVRPFGATNPMAALRLVYSIRPAPDAIYFMTDGEFHGRDATILNQIERRNAEARIPIYCITFVSDESKELMEAIVEITGGSYTHVPSSQP